MRKTVFSLLGLLLPVVLTGCGGSHSSSNAASTPAADVPAVVAQTNSGLVSSDYTLNILPSGSVTYNQYTISPPTNPGIVAGPNQTGTVSAALATQFFRDLTAAMPLQNLPAFTGTHSGVSTSVSVQYNGQTGPVDNPDNAHEVALEADIVAIAKALGLPQA